VIMLSDACVGQMMEPVTLPQKPLPNPRKGWAVCGDAASRENLVTTIFMNPDVMAQVNHSLQQKYRKIEGEYVRFEECETADADTVFVAFGISARLCRTAVQQLRRKGVRVGVLRPQTLWPFPTARLAALAGSVRQMVSVELSNGQMIDDIRLAVNGTVPVRLLNWMGGIVPSSEEIVERFEKEC